MLRQIGLDRTDAHHLMLAIRAECDIFLTCDKKTILNQRCEIESKFPSIKPKTPLELVAQITSGRWYHRNTISSTMPYQFKREPLTQDEANRLVSRIPLPSCSAIRHRDAP